MELRSGCCFQRQSHFPSLLEDFGLRLTSPKQPIQLPGPIPCLSLWSVVFVVALTMCRALLLALFVKPARRYVVTVKRKASLTGSICTATASTAQLAGFRASAPLFWAS